MMKFLENFFNRSGLYNDYIYQTLGSGIRSLYSAILPKSENKWFKVFPKKNEMPTETSMPNAFVAEDGDVSIPYAILASDKLPPPPPPSTIPWATPAGNCATGKKIPLAIPVKDDTPYPAPDESGATITDIKKANKNKSSLESKDGGIEIKAPLQSSAVDYALRYLPPNIPLVYDCTKCTSETNSQDVSSSDPEKTLLATSANKKKQTSSSSSSREGNTEDCCNLFGVSNIFDAAQSFYDNIVNNMALVFPNNSSEIKSNNSNPSPTIIASSVSSASPALSRESTQI